MHLSTSSVYLSVQPSDWVVSAIDIFPFEEKISPNNFAKEFENGASKSKNKPTIPTRPYNKY